MNAFVTNMQKSKEHKTSINQST